MLLRLSKKVRRRLALVATGMGAAATAATTTAAAAASEPPLRLSVAELAAQMARVLEKHGVAAARAAGCAQLFAEAQRDGIFSHGCARFPSLVSAIVSGHVSPTAAATRVSAAAGSLEQWDGHEGIGPLNAQDAMNRAIALAKTQGIGCVALRNTSHWMRAGAYGLQAADAGCIGVCWTNTCALMAPWGDATKKLGNNPLVIAIPSPPGEQQQHLLLDMAMSQFSLGKLEMHRHSGVPLPVPGGYDSSGELSTDASAIHQSSDGKAMEYRAVPMGYWKGAGLALMLDVAASLLSQGKATHEVDGSIWAAGQVSQVFVAIDPARVGVDFSTRDYVREVVEDLHGGTTRSAQVRAPGEGMYKVRAESLAAGVQVDPELWRTILSL